MSKKIKKYVLPYFPYLIAFWFFSKCGTAYRMAAGANLGEKLFGMVKTIGPVFQSYAPGLGLLDLVALLLLQKIAALGECAALWVYHHIGRMSLQKLGREPEAGLARA